MAPDRGAETRITGPSYQAISSSDEEPLEDVTAVKATEHEPEESEATESLQDHNAMDNESQGRRREQVTKFLAERSNSDTNFTVRGVLVGLGIGIIICFSNTYFGLQTGWVSGMAMPGR
jgi:cell division protein FtsX